MVPRYVYRLEPVLAVALAIDLRPGEWAYSLRARSEAAAVSLGLSETQVIELQGTALAAASAFDDGRFPLGRVRPYAPDDPVLRGPYDLEARADNVVVARDPERRLVRMEVVGGVDGSPYQVAISAIPEQMLALAEQIAEARSRIEQVCAICGQRHRNKEHDCLHNLSGDPERGDDGI